jgi:hypothetical protein
MWSHEECPDLLGATMKLDPLTSSVGSRPDTEPVRAGVESTPETVRVTRIGVWLSVALYLAACALPALRFGETGPAYLGWVCLTAFPFVLFSPYWYANPVFLWGLVAYGRAAKANAADAGLSAALLASTFFFLMLVEPLERTPSQPRRLAGSWVWLGSLWLFAYSTWSNTRRKS